jgi:probable HAF family extracellular repeat protein
VRTQFYYSFTRNIADEFRVRSGRIVLALLLMIPSAAYSQVLIDRLSSISGDGSVVLGVMRDPAKDGESITFRWGMETGITVLNGASAVSADGRVVVGATRSEGYFSIFRWTQAGGMVHVGNLNLNGGYAYGLQTNSDGSVVVGGAYNGVNQEDRAFRWTQAEGMVGLGDSQRVEFSWASGVSGDGKVIVGSFFDRNEGVRAFRWTESSGMVSLGSPASNLRSLATGVSADGRVVAGYIVSAFGGTHQAFRWTEIDGMVKLVGGIATNRDSRANGVSGDGNVVVGSVFRTVPHMFSVGDFVMEVDYRAFRWTQQTGMQSVEDWLRANGVRVAADTTIDATATNADGSVVIGQKLDANGRSTAFIARVAPAGNGLITIANLHAGVSSSVMLPRQATALGAITLHGAHSRPLAHRVEPGKACFWTSGDLGRDNHKSRDEKLALAEVGGCMRFGAGMQGALSVGRAYSRQALALNGKSDMDTTYAVAEVLGNIPGTSLWPSVSLLHQRGEIDARRGYINAGLPDSSAGSPDVRTTALRLRLDWENAARLGNTSFTPYADASHARTFIDGYTETGGGFPARFDGRSEKSTEARLGVDVAHALSSRTKLLGRIEAAHRVEKSGAGTSGNFVGLFGFRLPGEQHKRDWLRAGVGFETKAGVGTISAMLNATTQGSVPSYWLNVAYMVAF